MSAAAGLIDQAKPPVLLLVSLSSEPDAADALRALLDRPLDEADLVVTSRFGYRRVPTILRTGRAMPG
jgi:hypothetical protein